MKQPPGRRRQKEGTEWKSQEKIKSTTSEQTGTENEETSMKTSTKTSMKTHRYRFRSWPG